jgi:hypothetical protein
MTMRSEGEQWKKQQFAGISVAEIHPLKLFASCNPGELISFPAVPT